jgi:O-methyltransferase involved in polyketide biosynthesis
MVLPALHRWDPVAPSDTCVNLMVIWLKALSGNRLDGMADSGISYAFLPPITRWLVGPHVAWLYPRLHHQNIAMRSSFLERAVRAELNAATGRTVALVTLGAGFDGRSLRYATNAIACVELGARAPAPARRNTTGCLAACFLPKHYSHLARLLPPVADLPEVIEQKRGLVERAVRRLPVLETASASITYIGADLSNVLEGRAALKAAMVTAVRRGSERFGGHPRPAVIIICEALLIYLPVEAATQLLRSAVQEAHEAGAVQISLCFADALPEVKSVAHADAQRFLTSVGLQLVLETWTPKPGLARHMGVARVSPGIVP